MRYVESSMENMLALADASIICCFSHILVWFDSPKILVDGYFNGGES